MFKNEKKNVYFGKNSENSPKGMKIYFYAQDEEEVIRIPSQKVFPKITSNFQRLCARLIKYDHTWEKSWKILY